MPCELPPTTWTVRNQWEMPTGGNSHRIRVDQVKDPAFRRADFSRWKFMEAQESREEQPAWTLAWQVSPENSNGWKMTSTFWWKKNWPIFGGQTCCKVTTLLSIFSQHPSTETDRGLWVDTLFPVFVDVGCVFVGYSNKWSLDRAPSF